MEEEGGGNWLAKCGVAFLLVCVFFFALVMKPSFVCLGTILLVWSWLGWCPTDSMREMMAILLMEAMERRGLDNCRALNLGNQSSF